MADNQRRAKKKGAPRSVGKRHGKIAVYYNSLERTARKLRRVIRSSGFEEGKRWAEKNAELNDARMLDLLRVRRLDGQKEMPNWLHDKMHEAVEQKIRQDEPGKLLPEMEKRVGRALRRREKFSAKQA